MVDEYKVIPEDRGNAAAAASRAASEAADAAADAATTPAVDGVSNRSKARLDNTRSAEDIRATEQPVVAPPAAVEDPKEKAEKSALARFLKLTGYTKEEVISANGRTRTYATANGGKYLLAEKGTQIRRLQGPLPPTQLRQATGTEENGEEQDDSEE